MSDSVLDSILAAAESMSVSKTPPPSPPGGSAFLIGRRAPLRGVIPEGTVVAKLFSVVDIDCSDTAYCFGIIGNGSAFCIKNKCKVKTHANVKLSFAGTTKSFIFIRRNIPGSVFCEPRLPVGRVPSDVMSEWQSKSLSLADWSLEFQAMDGTSEIPTSTEEIHTETDFLIESSILRTPSKRRKDSFSGDEYEGYMPGPWKNPKYERTIPEDPLLLESFIDEGVKKGVLTTTVSKIESYIKELGEVVLEVNGVYHDRLVTLEDSIEVMIGMIQTLKARFGSPADLGERFTAPTLWGSTAFMAEDLSKVTHEMEHLHEDTILPMQESLALLNDADVAFNIKSEKIVSAVRLLLTRVQAVNDSMQEVKSDLVLVRTEQGVRFAAMSPLVPKDPADELMDFILADERECQTPIKEGGLVGVSERVTPPSSPDSASSNEGDNNVRSILSKLMDDVKALQAAKQHSSVKFGGLGFSDLGDCLTWIEAHFSGHQYGLIMDPLLMLDRIYGDDEMSESGGALLKAMELQHKMKIDSGNEAAALNALRYSRPRIFHKGRPIIVSVQNKSRLNLLASHSDWNPGGEGVMDFCVMKMNLLEASIADEIGHTFPLESTAHWIATKCLSATVSFLTQLYGCVESIYKRLHNFSKFTTEQAWSLTTQVLERILADLFIPKDNILQSLKARNTSATCAQVLFASFKTHDIMAGYVAHKFENHPSVSTEYVKFLATNSGSEKVVKLSETLETVKTKANNASDEAKAATKKADVAGAKIADLVKEVASLTQKVKSMESRK